METLSLRKNNLFTHLCGLIKTGRPLTGLYAFLLTVVSFKFFDWEALNIGLATGVIFFLLTMSIMRFNDLIDRENDNRKGKSYALHNTKALFIFWLVEALLLVAFMLLLAVWSVPLAVFCASVWIVGMGYSFMPKWYITQNVLVAVCAGFPALCAIVYFGQLEVNALATFCLLTSLIWVSEVHKDIEDQKTDVGYKVTIPTKIGNKKSVLLLIASLHIITALFFLHPIVWLQLVAVTFVPKMAYEQGLTLLGRASINRAMLTMNYMIAAIGAVLYLS